MSDCCSTDQMISISELKNTHCPQCNQIGRRVNIITLKSLLLPSSLEQLNVSENYMFCATQDCEVVYYGDNSSTYTKEKLKVPVYQKELDEEVNICYCFDWSLGKIKRDMLSNNEGSVVSIISNHMKKGRCGCEVNNPQGSCCLGNVKEAVKRISNEI